MRNYLPLAEQVAKIAPTDLRSYALIKGWEPVEIQSQVPTFLLRHPTERLRQITIPKDNDYDDYKLAVLDALQRLSETEKRPTATLIAELLEPRADAIRFRINSPRADSGSLPLHSILDILDGAKTCLLAAAHSVEHRQPYHPRLNRAEGKQLIERALFGQTEHGSFGITIYCPLNSVDIPSTIDPLEPDLGEVPFVRRTTNLLMSSVGSLLATVNASRPNLAGQTSESGLSTNLCDSLLKILAADDESTITLATSWAPLLPKPPSSLIPRHLVLRQDYVSAIEDVRQLLLPPLSERATFYVGTVEELYGEFSASGHRAGEVLLSILDGGEKIPTRVELNEAQYETAVRIHQAPNSYVRLFGKLQKRAKISRIVDLTEFAELG